jgi:hypothetical protein
MHEIGWWVVGFLVWTVAIYNFGHARGYRSGARDEMETWRIVAIRRQPITMPWDEPEP